MRSQRRIFNHRKGIYKNLDRRKRLCIMKLFTFDHWSAAHVPNWERDRLHGDWNGLSKGFQSNARTSRQIAFIWNESRRR